MHAATSAVAAECEVTNRWLGFHRIWHGSGEVFDTVDLFLPDVQFSTQARRPLVFRRYIFLPGHVKDDSCGCGATYTTTWIR